MLHYLLGILPRLLGGTRFDADPDPLLRDLRVRGPLSIFD